MTSFKARKPSLLFVLFQRCEYKEHVSDIAKLSSDHTSYCYECCSKDGCNKELCDYPPRKNGRFRIL